MAFFTSSLLYDMVGVLVALVLVAYTLIQRKFSYWARKGLYTESTVFLFGDAKDVVFVKMNTGQHFAKLYHIFKKKGLRHAGSYFSLKNFYIPVDLNIVKRIMQTDFQHFVNHGIFVNEKNDPVSAHLFSLEDDRWRSLRAKLTPTFTSGKMKMMFGTLVECSKEMKTILENHSKSPEAFDIRDLLQRFTMEIISSCAFGLESNSIKNPDSDFAVHGRKILEPNLENAIRNIFGFFFNHNLLRFFGMRAFNKKSTNFLINIVEKNVEFREKNNIYRKDFMHLLLQLKNRGNVFDDEKLTDNQGKQGLTLNEVAAQVFVFFIAGYETSSTAMTFALYELAQQPKLQDKIRDEVEAVLAKHNGELTYDSLKEMTYLEQVIDESLRKYPPIPVHFRKCNKDYKVPDSDVVIAKGDSVAIPALGIHRDPEYYPDPEKFDPDRFSEENKAKRHPFAWIPFGEGPRVCIGLRFGMMQAKVGLITVLRDYNVTLGKNMTVPIKLDPKGNLLFVDGGVWIHINKRQKI